MRSLKLLALFAAFCSFIATSVYAENCVRVRNGNSYSCMQFSPKEQKIAAMYGLHLGSPYKTVQKNLLQHGWHIDQNWLQENSSENQNKNQLVCGSGWDAVCSVAYSKKRSRIILSLSGTNSGLPLISVEDSE